MPYAGEPVRYRLPPPQLYPITRPRPPRRYGDAGAPFAFGVGASLLWRKDEAYKLFTASDPGAGLELFATYDIWTPFRGAIVAAGLSYRFQGLGEERLDLSLHAAQAELMARFAAASWLWPHLRVAVGVNTTRFHVDDGASDLSYEDHTAGVASTFGGGFTLRTPSRLFETWGGHLSSLSLGLLLEAGYTLEEAAELEAKPTRSSDLARTTFPLGKLERNAAYMRVTGVVRF